VDLIEELKALPKITTQCNALTIDTTSPYSIMSWMFPSKHQQTLRCLDTHFIDSDGSPAMSYHRLQIDNEKPLFYFWCMYAQLARLFKYRPRLWTRLLRDLESLLPSCPVPILLPDYRLEHSLNGFGSSPRCFGFCESNIVLRMMWRNHTRDLLSHPMELQRYGNRIPTYLHCYLALELLDIE
jgi:hypothetical protein